MLFLLSLASMLSLAPPTSARQPEGLAAIKRSLTPAQQKIDSRLFLAILHQRDDPRLAALVEFRFLAPDPEGRFVVDVDVVSSDGIDPVVSHLERIDAAVISRQPGHRAIRARLPLVAIEELAALPEVRRIGPVEKPRTAAGDAKEEPPPRGAGEARRWR